MIGPDNSVSGFTKNIYLYLAIGIALIAAVVVYSAAQGNTESELRTLSKTSQRFAKAIGACKTAAFDIGGKHYALMAGISPSTDPNDGSTLAVLRYTNHAVRGNVNSDAFYDMLCTYDLEDPSVGPTRTYVGVLYGAEGGSFVPGSMLLVGTEVTVSDISISGGIGTISYLDASGGYAIPMTKKFFLEGDTLIYADTKNGL